eukprot:scaffold18419_cov66-Phaeocystis_antarctica.AAC.2
MGTAWGRMRFAGMHVHVAAGRGANGEGGRGAEGCWAVSAWSGYATCPGVCRARCSLLEQNIERVRRANLALFQGSFQLLATRRRLDGQRWWDRRWLWAQRLSLALGVPSCPEPPSAP